MKTKLKKENVYFLQKILKNHRKMRAVEEKRPYG